MSISIAHPTVLAHLSLTHAPGLCGDVRAGLPSIRRTLLLAFLCMGSITASLGAYAVFSIGAVGHLSNQAMDGILISTGYARAASADFAALEIATARYKAHPEQGELPERIEHLSKALAACRSEFASVFACLG